MTVKAVDPWGPVCLHWRAVRAVSLMLVAPKARDILDTLQELIPFDTTDLLIDASDSDSLAYAAFAGWISEAETAGLISQAEGWYCIVCIGAAFRHVA